MNALFRRAIFLGVLTGGVIALQPRSLIGRQPADLRSAGTVDFPVSCSAAVQPDFNRAVALLHSFFYEEARRIFTTIADRDPNCAMAQWGIAMTWWHPIWTPPNPDEMRAGKAAAATAMAMAMQAGTDRERRFITALSAYYNTADNPTTARSGNPATDQSGRAIG